MRKVIAALLLVLASPAFAQDCDRYVTEQINCQTDQQNWKLLDKGGHVIQGNMNHRDCLKVAEHPTSALGLAGAPLACMK